jgi:hypothetical protein
MAKKLLNFFINEEKHGSHKMMEWQFGGRSDINKTKAMAFVDMWPTTLKKFDNQREMQKQYQNVTNAFGLESHYDLMSISYVMLQMHVLLFAKVKEEDGRDEKLQIHVASSATNKYIFGNGPGVQKYLERYVSPNYEQSSGPHPQLWLMGGTKNENVWPDDVRRVITSNLRHVYGNVHEFNDVDFESKIMTIFGSTSSSIAVGLYSRTARVFEDASLLDLDMRSESPKHHQGQPEYVRSILSKCDISDAIINFMTIELKTSDLSLVMSRLRSFNASHRMHFIASNLPDTTSEFSKLTSDLQAMIEGLSSTLDKTTDVVLRKLQRMKIAQDRPKLLHHLAKVFNYATGDIEDRKNEVRNDPEFKSFMKAYRRDLTSETDREGAIEAVMKTARAYDKTFWTHFTKLVAYIGEHPNDFVTIGDTEILIIDTSKNQEKYNPLKKWLEVMNGYSNHMNYTEHSYGLKAYKMMGSIEQLALAEKRVCFNPVLYGSANVTAQERKFSSNQLGLISDLF